MDARSTLVACFEVTLLVELFPFKSTTVKRAAGLAFSQKSPSACLASSLERV